MWSPPPEISKKEFLGRRAFGSDVGFTDRGVTHYEPDLFMDERPGSELSFDRLGIRERDFVETAEWLLPYCEEIAKKGATTFKGWARILVRDLKELRVSPTEPEGEENPYHAELDRSKYYDEELRYTLAFRLCTLCAKNDFLKIPESC